MSRRRIIPHGAAPYLFIAPFALLFAVFTAYPLAYSVLMALEQNYGPRQSVFVGLDNFRWLLDDPEFRKALRNTFVFAAGSVFIQLPCALGLAMLLNQPRLRGRGLFRLVFFAPVLVGLAFVAIMFALIFEKNTGLLNVLLFQLTRALPGAPTWNVEFPWLQDFIMPALIIAAFWMYVGYNMVYFLAALQNVSEDLIEAATVDGANAWHRFRYITIPAIRPIATFVVLLSLVGSMQLFELPYLLVGPAGGKDGAGLTVVMYLFNRGFTEGDLGYASAIGWILAMILLGFAAMQKVLGRTETDR
ncbi:MAG: arabinose ABC transporter permease [Phycisphaeraceae bacterium]|nr:arabinose ABC transporter permease [Phycisphaeraceae bacterium]